MKGILVGVIILVMLVSIPSICGKNVDHVETTLNQSDSIEILLKESCSNEDVSIQRISKTNRSWSENFIPPGISQVPTAVWHSYDSSRRFLSSSTTLISLLNSTKEVLVSISNKEWKINWEMIWEQYFSFLVFPMKCLIYFSLTMLLFFLFISAL